jgi:CBS domain-containing protein
MKVKEIMIRDVKCCHPGNNLEQAAEIMAKGDCGVLPVLDESGHLLCMITDRDICIALGACNRRPSEVRVSEVTSARYFACNADEDILSALETMATQAVRRLPVLDKEKRLAGILSMDDIVLYAKPNSEVSFEEVIMTLKAIYKHGEEGEVTLPARG